MEPPPLFRRRSQDGVEAQTTSYQAILSVWSKPKDVSMTCSFGNGQKRMLIWMKRNGVGQKAHSRWFEASSVK